MDTSWTKEPGPTQIYKEHSQWNQETPQIYVYGLGMAYDPGPLTPT